MKQKQTEEKTKQKAKQQKKSNKRLIGLVVLMTLLWGPAIFIDSYGRMAVYNSLINCWGGCLVGLANFLRMILPDDTGDFFSVFSEIWGIAITIMIFIIELSGNVKYGISLKRITVLIVGKVAIYMIAGIYLCLYPIGYMLCQIDYKATLFVCWATTIIGLFWTLFFCVRHTRGKSVRSTLKKDTIRVLKKKCERNFQHHPGKIGHSIRSEIDSLSITDMIVHTDYSNMEETRNTTETVIEVLTDADLKQCINNTFAEHTLLMNWETRIIQSFELEKELQRETLMELNNEIWTRVTCPEDETGNVRRQNISSSVQLLIPFVNLGGEIATQLLIRLWKRMYGYKAECIVYLILYAEYRYWTNDREWPIWFESQDSQLQDVMKKIARGEFQWDCNLGKDFWIDWSQYNKQQNDIGLRQYLQFSEKIDQMRGGISNINSGCVMLEFILLKWG